MKFIKDHLLQRKARSREHFFKLLVDNGFELTYNHAIPSGVVDTNGKSYSWQKLGISPEDFYQLDYKAELLRISDRLDRLEKIRSDKQQDRTREP